MWVDLYEIGWTFIWCLSNYILIILLKSLIKLYIIVRGFLNEQTLIMTAVEKILLEEEEYK